MLSLRNKLAIVSSGSFGRLVSLMAVCGLVGSTVWTLSTFVIVRPVLPFWGVMVFFLGVFPVHFRTAFGLRRSTVGRPWRLVGAYRNARAWLSGREILTFGVAFFAYWLIAWSSIHALGSGQAEIDHGVYYANDHGALTRISEAEYNHLQLLEQRLFTAVPAAFYLVGVAYGLGVERYRRRAVASA